MQLFVVTVLIFGTALAALAVGVILQGEKMALKGSCGGPDTNPDCCQTCPDVETCDDAPNTSDPAAVNALSHVPLNRAGRPVR